MKLVLKVNGSVVSRNLSDWTFRFVEGDIVTPVLYYQGMRVTDRWSIELEYDSAPDKNANANTASVPV